MFRTIWPVRAAVPQAAWRDAPVVGGTGIWISREVVADGSLGDDAVGGDGFGWRFMEEAVMAVVVGSRRYVV